MTDLINKHFDLVDVDVEAQALNEKVVADATTSEENVPTGEGQNESQASMFASDMHEMSLEQNAVQEVDCEVRASIHAECTKKGAVKQEYFTIRLSDLIAMNYILATFMMNRQLSENHVKKLLKDVRRQGKKSFSQAVIVCSAMSALLRDYDVIGPNGKPVTYDTPDLDKILVILDGQHRVAGCLGTELEIDCDVMIVPCPDDIAQDIKDRNCTDRNWDTNALRHQIVETEKKCDMLAEYKMKASNIYPGCSDKFYEYILTRKKDAVRRAQVARGELPACDVSKAEMGLEIARSLRCLNSDCNKNASQTLKIVDIIMNKMEELADGSMTRERFVKMFLSYASLHENVCGSKDGAEEFIACFNESFSRFIKDCEVNESELVAINDRVERIISAGPAKPIKSLTSSFHEMIQRIKANEEVAAQKADKKAKKEAIQAAKQRADQKRKGAGDVVEKMAAKAGPEIKHNNDKK